MDNLYLIAIVSALISFVSTPIIKKLAFKFNVVDIPKDNRRVHRTTMPKLGGLAIYIAFLIMMFLKKNPIDYSEIGIIIGSLIIVVGGVIDDKYAIKPWQKLMFQIAAASVLIFFKVTISVITNPISDVNLYIKIASYISIPLTMFWVIGVTNAFNLIDGLDGLSAGLAFIACITMCIVAFLSGKGDIEVITLTVILGAAILGFLPYNFNPASIFMSDVGSQLIGFLLAAISLEGAIKSASAVVIAVPILAFGLPIYDTIFAIIRRKLNGKPIMQADKGHLHHRLLAMGLSQKQAVVIMYLISAVLGLMSVIVMQLANTKAYTVLAIVILIIVIIAFKFGIFNHND